MVWIIGLLIYLALSKVQISFSNRFTWIFGIAFLCFSLMRLYVAGDAYDTLYVLLLGITLYFGISYLQNHKISIPKPLSPTISFFANYSFTLFLIHYSLMDLFRIWQGKGMVSLLFAYFTCNIAAIIMYFLFEKNDHIVKRQLKKLLKIHN
jgi:peptidoglycan/LPS O-acetylase OafA/YrhL